GCRDAQIPSDGSVTKIAAYAFSGCGDMTSVAIPGSVTSIGEGAFAGCGALCDVFYNNTEAKWNSISIASGNDALLGAELHFKFHSGTCGDDLTWTFDASGELTISGTGKMTNYKVVNNATSAPWGDFSDPVRSVTISEGVTTIGYYAFYGCTDIEEVSIPEGITSIGNAAFYGCSKLGAISLPNSVDRVRELTFKGCTSLETVSMSNSIKNIFGNAFDRCDSLRDVYFTGDEAEWNAIPKAAGNSALGGVSMHYIYCGVCGESVTWSLEADTLVIGGEGAMYDYKLYGSGVTFTPWEDFADQIANVVIGEGVTYVGSFAFYGCSSIESVTLPESVVSIGDGAFRGCSALTDIELPGGVTSIGAAAFRGCSSLAGIDLPEGVIHIADQLFYNCSSLSHITISGATESIGSSVFRGCVSLTYNSYANAKYLGSAGVPYIALISAANKNVTSCTINAGTRVIAEGAFDGCSALTRITIPAGVVSIGDGAFLGCSALGTISAASGNTVYRAAGNCLIEKRTKTLVLGCKNSTIPSDGSVTSIGRDAFADCTGLTAITVPGGVTSIGFAAFAGCTSLSDVTYTDNEINWSAIEISAGNGALEGAQVHFALSASEVDSSGTGDDGLTWTLYTDGTLVISGSGAMTNYELNKDYGIVPWKNKQSSIKSLYIESGVTSIGNNAFASCSKLASVRMSGNTVTSIGTQAFRNCSSLTAIEIPRSVTSFGRSVFSGCSGLTSIKIPSGVTAIMQMTFQNCTKLTAVEIPESVTSISSKAFYQCRALTDIYYAGSVEAWGAVTIGTENDFLTMSSIHCESTIPVDAPSPDTVPGVISGVCGDELTWELDTEAGELTISGVGAMYDFPEDRGGVTGAPWGRCSQMIRTVYVMRGVTSIGDAAFLGCSELTDLYYRGTEEEWEALDKGDNEDPLAYVTLHLADPFEWDLDNWSFTNEARKDTAPNGGYAKGSFTNLSLINDVYLRVLEQSVSNTDFRNISNFLNGVWKGSCYGMSSLVLLANAGLLPYSDYQNGAECLNDLDAPVANGTELPSPEVNLSSLIMYYHVLQETETLRQKRVATTKRTHKENITELISLLDKNDIALVGYQNGKGQSHAIVAYGYDYGTFVVGGVTYQGRIRTWDPNASVASEDERADYFIYFNTSTYEWTAPGAPFTEMRSERGAVIIFIATSIDEINACGYLPSENVNGNVFDHVTTVYFYSASGDRRITKVEQNESGAYVERESEDGEIVESYDGIMCGDGAQGMIGYSLYDADASYKVTQKEPVELSLKVNYDNCMLYGGSKVGNSVLFDKAGLVSVTGDNAEYTLGMVYDDGYQTDWFAIEVNGASANKASLRMVEGGWILSSDDLTDVAVKVNNKVATAEGSLSTRYGSVFIYEIDENTIGFSIDADGDGTYETPLGGEDPVVTPGDANGDGKITNKDLSLLKRIVAGTLAEGEYFVMNADVNGDGKLN
ncbi:MAG: leucine-rich repeat protein, partial [Clostridia bacterium]|nr:leucine-rich repeat protein [Clostridia bacterium]